MSSREAARLPRSFFYTFIGLTSLLTLWMLLSLMLGEALVPSPLTTAASMYELAVKGVLGQQVLMTLAHLALGSALGFLAGFLLGLAAGLSEGLGEALRLYKWIGLTAPLPVVAVIAMLWFGIGDFTVVALTAFVVAPLIYVSVEEGVANVSSELVEMARVYGFTRWMILREVYLPAIASSIVAGLTLVIEFGIRATIFGEFICGASGVGYALYAAWSRLSSSEVFAWTIVCIALAGSLEAALVRPLKRWSSSWRAR